MLLPDHEIERLCKMEAMVTPFNADHINPASLDVTLGDRIMIEVAGHPDLQILGITGHTEEDPFWIQPGEWFLAETREIFNLPDNLWTDKVDARFENGVLNVSIPKREPSKPKHHEVSIH